jgi:hypothetical protein
LRQRFGVLCAASEGETCVAQHFAVVGGEELDEGGNTAELKADEREVAMGWGGGCER